MKRTKSGYGVSGAMHVAPAAHAEEAPASPAGGTTPLTSVRRQTSFKGDVLRLVCGTGIAQAIGILAAPILARLYGPAAFGVVAMFSSLTGILGVLACMAYEQSIILPNSDREAANLLGLCLCLAGSIALLVIPVVWLVGPRVLQWVRMPKLLPYLWLVPVAVLFNGLFVALNYWNTRTKQFTRLSIAQVTSQLTTTSVSVGAGLAGHATFSAMIGASIGGQAVAVAALGTQIWCDNGRFLVESIRWREMVSGLKRHRNFPIFTTWSSLLNTASWQLPILMLGAFFSPVVVGFYALGFRILQMPMSLIGGAIRQVFLQRASAERASVELARLVQWLFQRLVVLTLLPSLILAVVGRDLFSVVLGANWAEAGIYAQILAPWALVWFISSPLSSLCYVLENQKEEMGIQAAIFLGRLLAIALGGLLGQPRMAIALFAVSGMLTYGYLIRILFGFVHLRARTVARECLGALRSSVVYMLPVLLAKALHLPAAAVLLASVAVLGVFFFRNREDLLILSNTS